VPFLLGTGQLVRRQRLTLDRGVGEWIDAATAEVVQVMPVDRQVGDWLALPEHHRDPADLIIATAIREQIELLSLTVFSPYQPGLVVAAD
jgi:PIN domain nuclease of toxin-antitoxin system